MSGRYVDLSYDLVTYTKNGDSVRVDLSLEVKAPEFMSDAAVCAIYDPLVEQLINEWAARHESASELFLDAKSFPDECMRIEHPGIPFDYRGVPYLAPPEHITQSSPNSPIPELDQKTRLLESLSRWLLEAPQKYPVVFSNPEDKEHVQTMINGLKRKIRGGQYGK